MQREQTKTVSYTPKEAYSLPQATPEAIVCTTGKGDIACWNHAAHKMFGCTRQEVLGKPLKILVPKRCHGGCADALVRVGAGTMQQTCGKTILVQGLKKSGVEFPAEMSIVRSNINQHTFFTAIVRDVTERQQTMNSLRQLSIRLMQLQDDER